MVVSKRSIVIVILLLIVVSTIPLQVHGSTTYYDYDLSNRLINKSVTSSGSKSTVEYTYDSNGNLLKKISVGNLDSLTNSDFEYFTGANRVADHWIEFDEGIGETLFNKTSSAYSGKWAQRISTNNIVEGNSTGISQTISVDDGRPYTLGGYFHISNLSGASVKLKIDYSNSSNQLIDSEETEIIEINQSYEYFSLRGNVPAGAISARIIISIQAKTSVNNGDIEVDSMNFEYSKPATLIAGGKYVTYALRNDGTVWGMGSNSSDKYTDTPSSLPGFENVRSLAVGNQNQHLVAIKEDGTVWTFTHYNYGGEAGDGTFFGLKYFPIQALGLTDVNAVAVGNDFSIALKSDGTVWTWGDNIAGQLGDGTTVNKSIPIRVPIDQVISVAAGNNFSLALKSDGTVWEWGSVIAGSGIDKRLVPTQCLLFLWSTSWR